MSRSVKSCNFDWRMLRLKDAPEMEIKKLEESLRNLEEEIKDFTSKTKWLTDTSEDD